MSHRSRTLTLFAGFFMVVSGGTPVIAQVIPQQPPVETEFGSEITVTATGVESEVSEVPVATTVITRKQMPR